MLATLQQGLDVLQSAVQEMPQARSPTTTDLFYSPVTALPPSRDLRAHFSMLRMLLARAHRSAPNTRFKFASSQSHFLPALFRMYGQLTRSKRADTAAGVPVQVAGASPPPRSLRPLPAAAAAAAPGRPSTTLPPVLRATPAVPAAPKRSGNTVRFQ